MESYNEKSDIYIFVVTKAIHTNKDRKSAEKNVEVYFFCMIVLKTKLSVVGFVLARHLALAQA